MRKIIVVLLLLCAKIAQAQIYIDSYRFAQPPAADLLLDDYPGAIVAYSLRKLDKDYTGSAIRIRTAGGSETDIGFDSNGGLNTAAITTFCAGTTCTVTTWYDQSGNGNNAIQPVVIKQPTIYTSGVIISSGGEPAIFTDAVNDNLLSTNTFTLSDATIFLVALQEAGDNGYGRFLGFNFQTGFFIGRNNTADEVGGGFKETASPFGQYKAINNSEEFIFYMKRTSANGVTDIAINSNSPTSRTTSTGATPSLKLSIGSQNTETLSFGKKRFKEIIIYNSNQSTNRTNIETNINSYYSIY